MPRIENWIRRWNSWINATPVLPGVFARRDGGFLIRSRVTAPTGRKTEIRRIVNTELAHQALAELELAVELATSGRNGSTPLFCDYAVSLLQRKIATREIRSPQGRTKWAGILEHHLFSEFGLVRVDELRRSHLETWRERVGQKLRDDERSPNTANTVLSVLRVIINTAVAEFELERNPIAAVKPFDTSEWHTYTEEQPNSLTPDEVPVFLSLMRDRHPKLFALSALGIACGQRPCTLRPLRRAGAEPDLLWEPGILLVRRSHTVGDDVMKTTKNKRHLRLHLPTELVEILRWHAERLPDGPMRESELLFPSPAGTFLPRNVLAKPFADVAERMGLNKRITPRAMRRTFQDLARAAAVNDVVTRAVSGHVTEAMQRHYSTVDGGEMRASLAKVVNLALYRR